MNIGGVNRGRMVRGRDRQGGLDIPPSVYPSLCMYGGRGRHREGWTKAGMGRERDGQRNV